VTYGLFFTIPMQEVCNKLGAAGYARGAAVPREFMAKAVETARADGVDIDQWVIAKVIHAVSGSVAEAKATGRASMDVLSQPECVADLNDAVRAKELAGWDDSFQNVICNAVEDVEKALSDPRTWNALLVLAAPCRTRALLVAESAGRFSRERSRSRTERSHSPRWGKSNGPPRSNNQASTVLYEKTDQSIFCGSNGPHTHVGTARGLGTRRNPPHELPRAVRPLSEPLT
jgi:hypothetical protein